VANPCAISAHSYIVGGSLWVVMELVTGGSLTEIVENIRHELQESQMAAICKATLEACLSLLRPLAFSSDNASLFVMRAGLALSPHASPSDHTS